MAELRTMEEWCDLLPKDVAEKVKENIPFNLDTPQNSLKIILGCAFPWSLTPEGGDYWQEIYQTYTDGKEPTEEEMDENIKIQREWLKTQKQLAEETGMEFSGTFKEGKDPMARFRGRGNPLMDMMLGGPPSSSEPDPTGEMAGLLEALAAAMGKPIERPVVDPSKAKPAGEWFEELPPEIAKKASYYAATHWPVDMNEAKVDSLAKALKGTFRWDDTDEGKDYWIDLHRKYDR